MTVTITHRNGTTVTISPVESVQLIRRDIVQTKTFGNDHVTHRAVATFAASYSDHVEGNPS